MKITLTILFIFLLGISYTSYPQSAKTEPMNSENRNPEIKKPLARDNRLNLRLSFVDDRIEINQIAMFFGNNGMGSFNRIADAAGFYWPRPIQSNKTAVFRDGMVWTGKVNGKIRAGGNTYRDGLQPGKIVNDTADDASLSKYRVYKVRKGWENISDYTLRDRIKKDWQEWPVEDGAPWVDKNNDGLYTAGTDEPEVTGDETNWMVMNDMNPAITNFVYGTQPMGLEIHSFIYGYERWDVLGDAVFKKYRIINKGNNTIDSMFLGYWSDPDIGVSSDDAVGCDTLLNMAYGYSGQFSNPVYGSNPPAVGYDLLQGPVIPYDAARYPVIREKNLPDSAYFNGKWIKGKTNLPMTGFTMFINGSAAYGDPYMGNPTGALQLNNCLNGKLWSGAPMIDPKTKKTVKYALYGDATTSEGWYEGTGWPGGPNYGDRRMLLGSGPFTLAPGDTQEVTFAIIIGHDAGHIGNITKLKNSSRQIQKLFNGVEPATNVKEFSDSRKEFSLEQNYPNPFNPSTMISYSIAQGMNVELKVFDLLGKEVVSLVNEYRNAGLHSVKFDGSDLPSGIYFYKIKAGSYMQTKKLLLLK